MRVRVTRGLVALILMTSGAVALATTSASAHNRDHGVAKRYEPQIVRYRGREAPGTIVIDRRKFYLYLVLPGQRARRYGVGLGRQGLAFRGSAVVRRKTKWPKWTPTRGMIEREPQKYARFAKGVPGGPGNPLGARALYLFKGSKDTLYRIHGTNAPRSIGRAVSNGCVRMLNSHVVDLYRRVRRGARVVVR